MVRKSEANISKILKIQLLMTGFSRCYLRKSNNVGKGGIIFMSRAIIFGECLKNGPRCSYLYFYSLNVLNYIPHSTSTNSLARLPPRLKIQKHCALRYMFP